MQPGGHLEGECHLACSDPMKSGTEPHEPVAPHTVPSVWPVPQEQRLISTGGLALCGTTCPPPYVRSMFWALISFLRGPEGLHFH